MNIIKYSFFASALNAILILSACATIAPAQMEPAESQVEAGTQSPTAAIETQPSKTATITPAIEPVSAEITETVRVDDLTATPTPQPEEKIMSTPVQPPQPKNVAPRDDPPPPSPPDLARFDLSGRLKVNHKDIKMVEVTTKEPDEAFKNCLGEKSLLANANQVQWITLQFKNQNYHYLALGDIVIFCHKTNK